MEERKLLIKKICGVVASFTFLTVISRADILSTPLEQDHSQSENFDAQNESKFGQKLASCQNTAPSSNDRYLMLVSTLDGKISALNMEKEGALEWSINTGSNPLLSSSISNLELSRDGRRTRLIPSLDGGLYQYDGVSVEPVPFNAETLLSSSFRLNDHSIMVGGKESETYGVDLHTGRVKYVCDMEGCKQFEHGSDDDSLPKTSQTLVISRTTRTVRAVEMVSGAEKWNFSVGEHEIAYISAATRDLHDATAEITDQSAATNAEDEDAFIENCEETEYNQDESLFDFPWWNAEEHIGMDDLHFKVIVPKGLILAVLKSQPSRIVWKHQFSHAIAKAWTLQSGELNEMDLFDASHVPALGFDAPDSQEQPVTPPPTPALYIGTHERQVYVQASVNMQQAVEESVSQAVATSSPITMPTVTWKPYIASSPSRTPAEMRNPLQIAWENGRLQDENDETALSLWCEYPHDVGYYLYPDTTTTPLPYDNGSAEADTSDFYFEEDITVTLWNWWKEVLAISVLSSIVLNIIVVRLFFPKPPVQLPTPTHSRNNSESVRNDEKPTESNGTTTAATVESQVTSLEKPIPFASRYESDFELVERLGQGGFGVVFHVKNRIDDVDYAIKRITLNNSQRSKDRVNREVKALAKLNHPHIVRYHQAWVEYPPAGWQEHRDLQLFPGLTPSTAPEMSPSVPEYSPANSYSVHDLKSRDANSEIIVAEKNNDSQPKKNDFNPLKPFNDLDFSHHNFEGNDDTDSSSAFGGGVAELDTTYSRLSDTRKHGSTGKFVPLCDTTNIPVDISSDSSFGVYNQNDVTSDNSESFVRFDGRQGLFSSHANAQFLSEESSIDVIFNDQTSTQDEKSLPFKQYTRAGHDESMDIVFEESAAGDNREIEHSEQARPSRCKNAKTAGRNTKSVNNKNSGDSCLRNINDDDDDDESVCDSSDSNSGDINKCTHNCDLNSNEKGSHETNIDQKRPKSLELRKIAHQKEKHDSGSQRIYLFIQMQLCKRHSLKDWLTTPELRDDGMALDIFWQIVSAVDYVHQSGLMHRDLKPSNILFALDGTVKVGDFGLVTAVEHDTADILTPAHSYGREHTDQVGTKLYMSPEQMEGRSYSHMVDIYALGLILFELFHAAFDTQMERVRTMLDVRRLRFPRTFSKERPQHSELARSLLSPRADERPSAAQILEHALLHAHEHEQTRARSASRTRTISQCSSHSANSNLSTSVPKDAANS